MRQVTHALLTRPPLSHSSVRKLQSASFDLHVLGTPPAFILSQDQTLMLKFIPVQNLAWLVLNRSTVVFRFCSECSHSWPITKGHFYKNFQGFTYCSVFKVRCRFLRQPDYYITAFFACQQLFSSFLKFFNFFFSWNAEGGIWTLAPLLTTYSLSRGAPSASLGTSPNCLFLFLGQKNGEGGIRTHAPFRTNGFQDRLVMTTSIPLHVLLY